MKDWDDTETRSDEHAATAPEAAGDDAEVAPAVEVTEAIEVTRTRPFDVPEADALDQAIEVDLDDDRR